MPMEFLGDFGVALALSRCSQEQPVHLVKSAKRCIFDAADDKTYSEPGFRTAQRAKRQELLLFRFVSPKEVSHVLQS